MTATQLELNLARDDCRSAWNAYRQALKDGKNDGLGKLKRDFVEKRDRYNELKGLKVK